MMNKDVGVVEVSQVYLVEAAERAVPVGYKRTEVGVIPEDWDVKKLKEISPSQSVGLVINPSSYYSERGTQGPAAKISFLAWMRPSNAWQSVKAVLSCMPKARVKV